MTQDMNHTFVKALRAVLVVMMTGSAALVQGQQQGTGVVIHGNVYGGGNLADVQTNTEVNICAQKSGDVYVALSEGNGVTIQGNVYGGGKGEANESGDGAFTCKKAMVGIEDDGIANPDGGTTVVIGNGTVGTLVNGTLKAETGNVYGGGEVGRVEKNTVVMIGVGSADTSSPKIRGNVFGAGEGVETHGYSALVRGNSNVTVQAKAEVGGSVYGGGEIATVGRYIVVNGYPTEPNGGGFCTVTIKDNAKVSGNVVGAGKGVVPKTADRKRMTPNNVMVSFGDDQTAYLTFLETLALANETVVTIGGNTTGKKAVVEGNVYGGSESGFVQRHTQVGILDYSEIGTSSADGNIYGGGKGLAAFANAGRVSGYTSVNVSGGKTYGSVFGGGEQGYVKGGVTVELTGTTGKVEGSVYGGGALADTNIGNGTEYVAVPGLTTSSSVNGLYEIKYKATTDETAINGKIYYELKNGVYVVKSGLTAGSSSVSGLSEIEYKTTTDQTAALGKTYYENNNGVFLVKSGLTAGVSSVSGLYEITYDLINSNATAVAGKSYYTITHTTTVNLLGGTIGGDAYGGGLGQKTGFNSAMSDIEATVYGDIAVNLGSNAENSSASGFYITYDTDDNGNSVVKSGRVFGCNNLNGSPQGDVTVTVWKTVNGYNADGTSIPKTAANKKNSTIADDHTYQLAAVYGGGNLASYTATDKKAHVIINGCDDTSILTVYGGGNAAAVPETDVDINAAYEIGAVFGGGNGKDRYKQGSTWQTNAGANVNGNATTMLYGGLIHEAFGGSNEKGTITGTVSINSSPVTGGCALSVGKLYGAGKNADIEGDLIVVLGCMPGDANKTEEVYGGAENANVKGDVELTITSGSFGKVFGGNNQSGAIFGHIILTIDESGCTPVKIDELYLGGNEAAYSVYGYYHAKQYSNTSNDLFLDEGMTIPLYKDDSNNLYKDQRKTISLYKDDSDYLYLDQDKTRPLYMPRTSESDQNLAVSFEGKPHTAINSTQTQYADPVLNIISATEIGMVFGGGLGSGATLYGNPTVNINQAQPLQFDSYSNGTTTYTEITGNLGSIGGGYTGENNAHVEGGIFGGGNKAAVYGNTTVNICNETTVNRTVLKLDANQQPVVNATTGKPETQTISNATVKGANIVGNVYGGGNLADVGYLADDTKENDQNSVYRHTNVNICAKDVTENNATVWKSVAVGSSGVTIAGNVYGGGKGEAETFKCEKAMVVGNTNVRIGNGTIGDGTTGGNVYGGGKIARVELSSEVTIGLPPAVSGGASAPVILNDVFAAGAGIKTHGYSALVRGNSTVTVQGSAQVKHNVYGGGEIASVGRYKVKNASNASEAPSWLPMGMPYDLISGGKSTVTVLGDAVIGPDAAMTMPDFKGHVFGAGKGVTPGAFSYADKDNKPKRMSAYNSTSYPGNTEGTDWDYVSETDHLNVWEYFKDEAAYFQFLETLAMSDKTFVTIGSDAQGATDKPFVKGSVYGGSENGHVRKDTWVKMKSGQIGCATGMNAAYADNVFTDPASTAISTSQATCPHWTYADNGYTFDKFADADGNYSYTGDYAVVPQDQRLTSSEGGRPTATDGHTFYGNVFGGGSGYFPFAPGKWYRGAGSVGGDTRVDIEGGHVLSCVYGGNEQTDVGTYRTSAITAPESGGKCIVNIMGGTVGVPRTKTDIQAHPVIGNVFGAGKGDKRVLFNTWTNVWGSRVNVTGGIVYGSVFGGGEDGHVLGNDSVYVTQASGKTITIGSTGESGADGNVFGGGRGSETALTAGVVGGNVLLTVNSGTILGSVYGGGRLASVGTNFVNPTIPDPDHAGQTIPNPDYGELQTPAADHGNITITINGGTIGTENSTGIGGNIFGASKGTTSNFRLGIVRSTTINMTDGRVYASVFGGGELAQVVGSHTTNNKTLGTEVNISGGTIGINLTGKGRDIWGNVFGGGKGHEDYVEAGLVKTNTKVSISQAQGKTTAIYHNIYGGGALGSVGTFSLATSNDANADTYYTKHYVKAGTPISWTDGTGSTTVEITGGTFGRNGYEDGHDNGMVDGASRGLEGDPATTNADQLAWVKNSNVIIGTSGVTSDTSPYIKGSVYGGGENGHNSGNAEVTVHSGYIGYKGYNADTDTYDCGNVYGAGCGTDPYTGADNKWHYNPFAGIVRGNTTVTVDGGTILHNVYGAGSMASVGTVTSEIAHQGDGYITMDNDEPTTEKIYGFGLSWPREFTYAANTGFTEVIIKGSASVDYVYGAAKGAVEVNENDITKHRYEEARYANVKETQVKIGESGTPTIRRSVYGGGEDGHVIGNTSVTITNGNIQRSVFGGGKGESTFKAAELWVADPNNANNHTTLNDQDVNSWTAGRVYGNTNVTMNGGSVGYFIYGGGNLASVGKGNYAGGSDDYSTAGYGELGLKNNDGTGGPIWTSASNTDYAYMFLNSGQTTVNVYGGRVGPESGTGTDTDGIPYGSVFGGSRGKAAASVQRSPRYRYMPDFFLGYVNKTIVNIGDASKNNDNSYIPPTVKGSVYGGGQDGHVRNSSEVNINKSQITGQGDSDGRSGHVFGAGSGIGTYKEGGVDKCNNSSGSVTCTSTVNVKAGTIAGNVYGGGAMASVGPPQTGQGFDEFKDANTGYPVEGGSPRAHGSYSYTRVVLDGGTISGDVFGASRGPSDDFLSSMFPVVNNVSSYNPDRYATDIWSDVVMSSGSTAVVNGSVYGGGEGGCVKKNTKVDLLGGTIKGDAYGGGKGTTNIAANIGGDVEINLGSATGSTATAFHITNYTGEYSNVVKSGRVFGCNNLNGSPQGDVTVDVWKTVYGNTHRTAEDTNNPGFAVKDNSVSHTYELAAVYGGGNLANYTASGKKTNVIIETCDVSVKSVYGGGNAAAVPETDVLINGAYEIAEVFGGGNGKDKYTTNGTTWNENPGANVNGNATTLLKGGYIHEAYGGSNSKGTISGDVSISKSSGGDCTLNVIDMYGAGKDADVEGDLIMIMGCSETRTENVYGCSKNANVKGNVELTITSGEYGKVFGGNNESGSIFGHIIVNIEEVGCSPIIIDELYGCGNDAAYSVYGYYQARLYSEGDDLFLDAGKTIPLYKDNSDNLYKDEDHTIPLYKDANDLLYTDQNKTRPLYMPRQSANDPNTAVTFDLKPHTVPPYADPEVNIISCTRIGRVFGGGLGSNATVYGNPQVNINMIKGVWAGQTYGTGASAVTPPNQLGAIGSGYTANNQTIEGGVFGGGNQAAVYGNTTVNIGTEQNVYVVKDVTTGADVSSYYTFNEGRYTAATGTAAEGTAYYEQKSVTGANIAGNVYGGGNLADVGKTHTKTETVDGKPVTTDEIDLVGSTSVNICAVEESEIFDAQNNGTGRYNYSSVSFAAGDPGVTILGNVYGGGKGEALASDTEALAGAFRCSKAMVTGSTSVAIGNGTIGNGTTGGSVYGGGEKGRVQENTVVTIGSENDETSAPVINGNVFGAGQGVSTHGYSALARGNSYVTVQGESKVKKSVYGGGEIASVGKYNVNEQGLPESLANQGSGYCTVIVRDNAVIGPDDAMIMTRTGGPDDYGHVFGAGKGVLPYEGYADNVAAWRVKSDNTKQTYVAKANATDSNESDYLTYVETLGLATQTYVTIDDNAFIKGSVYGGSENGYVQHDTQVNIQGNCQIGNGYVQMTNDGVYLDKLQTPETPMGVNRPYTATEWSEGKLIPDQTKEPTLYNLVHEKYYTSSLPECASWPYGQGTGTEKYVSYDKYYGATGYNAYDGRTTADDGHTYYGNVFGGGSGSLPYRPGKWHPEAGSVAGNTVVNITGGHILTNIYGGNELTDVKGKCTVNFGGTATLGVPRTLKQIAAHPVTCYLFGAGKGDPRVLFNKATNVEDVEVNITGGTIYGSVFGGGEDGHVLRDVKMTIGDVTTTGEGAQAVTTRTGPTIGTWGTSYVDGNVFGGGRGFTGDAYTAGNVAGSVKMEIKGGSILGSIYGGGRLGSVGYGLFESTDNTGRYGTMRPDDKLDDASNTTTDYYKQGAVKLGRGHIDISISGGTIGNNREYIIPNATNMAAAGIPEADRDISKWNDTNKYWDTWRTYHNIPKTEFDTTTGRLKHTKGGNVFAGGMGNFYKQDGVTYMSEVDWWKVGCAKSTKLTITGGTIKSNVYGGGELGQVVEHHTVKNAANEDVNLSTEITISGSNTTIGTEVKETVSTTTGEGQNATTTSEEVTRYTFGSVFGGGYGSLVEEITVNNVTSNPKYIAGLVKEDTKVDMQGGAVKASIYGGGEMASVGESTTSGQTTTVVGSSYVTVSNGTVGIEPITVSGSKRYFGGATMGNVYGGGSGSGNTVQSGKIFKNSNVNISGGTIYHNVYGGGAYGTVGDFQYDMRPDPVTNTNKVFDILSHTAGTGVATVKVTGGTIGYDGKENGMVFGSSRGDINKVGERDDHGAWVYDTHVTIGTSGSQTGPQINGTVYGSGENGHVYNDAEVTVNSGTIGIYNSSDAGYTVTSNGKTYDGAAYPYRGNVYGGGCGTDKYFSDHDEEDHSGEGDTYNYLSGIVYGNATVNITGGRVVRNVYGAGAMGSVGKVGTTANNNVTTPSITSGGLTTINISGGTIGVDATVGDGNVYGAARGDSITTQTEVALVKNTSVNISSNATVKGSVYGGGETGDVMENTEVNVCVEKQTNGETVTYVATSGNPSIGGNVFGGGKGSSNKFECDKAMVGIVNDGVTISGTSPNETYALKDGGTTVRIYNGTVGTVVETTNEETNETVSTLRGGNVYGGGEIARVERNTLVEIGAASGTTAPTIQGSVFAAGAGIVTHGYSALVRGTSTVTVQGSAKVLKNVYGGGEKASVGRYKVKTPANASDSDVPSTLPLGMPARLLAGGASTVNILGSATIGTADDDETGHVYGAGQGVVPSYVYTAYTDATPYATRITNSRRMVAYTSATAHPADKQYKEWDYYDGNNNYVWEYFPKESAYLQFVESLGISAETFVTIGGKRNETPSGNPTVNGSVFGGSESGFVYHNTDVKIQGGTVNGDAFGGGLGLESFAEAGRVRWNTNVAVSGGAVNGNVYGGGKLGDVGTIYKPDGSYDYIWRNTDANGNNLDINNDHQNSLGNNAITTNNKNTGICTVSIKGGTIGLASTDEPSKHGNVFGAGKGKEITWWCEKAIAYATNVSVTDGTVYGTVYGGGEVGRVEDDTKVTIGTSGESGTDKPNITGSVFGGGAGLATHGYSALVRGDAAVTVQGAAKVGVNVYGGGEIASVGRFKVDKGLPTKPKGGGTCTVIVKDNAVIGTADTDVTGDVYGSCKGVDPATISAANRKSMQLFGNRPKDASGNYKPLGDGWYYYEPNHDFVWVTYTEETYPAFLATLGLASNTHVTIGGSTTVNGSVYGGGQRGVTLGGVDVNITGGTVGTILENGTLKAGAGDVYGGGALANTNSSHWHEGQRTEYVELDELYKGVSTTGYYTKSGDTYTLITEGTASGVATDKYYAIFKTNVNLTGGTINRNVYGGGLGQLAKAAVGNSGQEGYVPAVSAVEAKVYGDVQVNLNKPTTPGDNTTCGDCEVKGSIFGCNNLNGSPQAGVDVHIYKTVRKVSGTVAEKAKDTYEVEAVYGGGNLAAYYPDDETARASAVANVTIDGCDLTSIQTVYGGGNAASTPATNVTINACYEIEEVFGGGNGKDAIDENTPNPGANVGYVTYSSEYDIPNSSKAERTQLFSYGSGQASVTIYDGYIHRVFGGSNTKGNVRESAVTLLDDMSGCHFQVDEAYGGGKNAPMDAEAKLLMACIPGLKAAYGGAQEADVLGGVTLTITNGTYERVFGGNNISGTIQGPIVVNIEETGCKPIVIGELYGGGNLAGYSVYGYGADRKPKESGEKLYDDPVVNVKSFTSIGNVYGGGYGSSARMVGDPTVNINVVKGKYAETYNNRPNAIGENARVVGSSWTTDTSAEGYANGYPIPPHEKDKIGAINNVFGGGNAAEVKGTPHVNIGTMMGEPISITSQKIEDSEGNAPSDADWTPSYTIMTVEGVNIRGNVYGGGNQAPVTGDTDVQIGKNNAVKTYSFTSYSAKTGGTAWSSGLAQTTGETKNGNAEVVILTNGSHGEFVGQKFYVDPNADTTGGTRTELKNVSGNSLSTPLYVAIKPFENKKTYSFTSYGASTGGTQYSTGTATATGNFKNFSGTDYMQIVVLTNPDFPEWVGKTFYVPASAKTDGTTRTQLYKANGTGAGVWVTITE